MLVLSSDQLGAIDELINRVSDRQRQDFGHIASDVKPDGTLITSCDRWSDADEGRITPPESLDIESRPDKIAWLWNTTNSFIDEFKAGLGKDRTLTVRSEDLFSNKEEAMRILNWLSFSADERSVQRVLDIPVNKSRKKKEKQTYDKALVPLVDKYYRR